MLQYKRQGTRPMKSPSWDNTVSVNTQKNKNFSLALFFGGEGGTNNGRFINRGIKGESPFPGTELVACTDNNDTAPERTDGILLLPA